VVGCGGGAQGPFGGQLALQHLGHGVRSGGIVTTTGRVCQKGWCAIHRGPQITCGRTQAKVTRWAIIKAVHHQVCRVSLQRAVCSTWYQPPLHGGTGPWAGADGAGRSSVNRPDFSAMGPGQPGDNGVLCGTGGVRGLL
jgi:hypothetical protein